MKKKEGAPKAASKPRKKAATTTSGAPRKRAPRAKKASSAIPAPRIDYPQEAERISSSGYTLRIDAPQNGLVAEVSIDDGAWQACRASVGFWWFDWFGFGSGEHVVRVRLVSDEGPLSESPARRCVVEL